MLQSDGLKEENGGNKDCIFATEHETQTLTSNETREETKNAEPSDEGIVSEARWACARCTYINYGKSSRCSMCNAHFQPFCSDSILETEPDKLVPRTTSTSPIASSSNDSKFAPVCKEETETNIGDDYRSTGTGNNEIHATLIDDDGRKMSDISEECLSQIVPAIQVCPSSSCELDSSQAPHIILDTSQKWSCPRCTFYNWPRSKVCVVCRAPPNWTRKTRNPSDGNTSDSFSKSKSPEIVSSDEGSGGSSISSVDHKSIKKCLSQTWQCTSCTYENYSKATKCVICSKKKPNSVDENQNTISKECQKVSPPVTLNRKGANKCNARNREAVLTIEERMKRLNIRRKSPSSNATPTESKKKVFSKDSVTLDDYKYFQCNNRFSMSKLDWMFLQACWAVSVGAVEPVESYIIAGGDKKRILTAYEASVLDIPGVVERFNLVMIALLFKRARIIEWLMSHEKLSFSSPSKYPACGVSADLTNQIMRTISNSLRIKNGTFKCHVFQDNIQTYGLPAEIHKLPKLVQKQLMSEIIDQSVKRELEVENCVINWNREVTVKLKSKLRPLWNRTAGDCLLDAVLQATWGVFDSQNVLRKALADTLKMITIPSSSSGVQNMLGHNAAVVQGAGGVSEHTTAIESMCSQACSRSLFQRWKEQEMRNALDMGFTLDNKQLEDEWSTLTKIAAQPGQALEQLHIFVLAHILRRPIIVYGVKVVKSFRGEEISPARFEGVYLPLLWEPSFCNRNPVCLSYTPGHFSALVTLESVASLEANCNACSGGANGPHDAHLHGQAQQHPHPTHQKFESPNYYLALVDCDLRQLPVHFLLNSEVGQDDILLNQMLDCIVTPGGILVARFLVNCSNGGVACSPFASATHPLVNHMNDLWLERYRVLASTMNQSEDEMSGAEDRTERRHRVLATTIQ